MYVYVCLLVLFFSLYTLCKPLCCVFLSGLGGLHGHRCLVVACWLGGCRSAPSVQNALSRSYNSNAAPLSWSHYGSCRDMHGSRGSLLFNAREGQPYAAPGFSVSTATVLVVPLAPAARTKPRDPRKLQIILVSHPLTIRGMCVSFSP